MELWVVISKGVSNVGVGSFILVLVKNVGGVIIGCLDFFVFVNVIVFGCNINLVGM